MRKLGIGLLAVAVLVGVAALVGPLAISLREPDDGTTLAPGVPGRVDRLILVEAFYPPEPGEIPLVFRALRTPIVGELALGLVAEASAPGFSAAYRERALPWHRIRGTRSGFLRYVRDEGKRAELSAAYPAIAAPTLVLHGTADQNVTYAAMQRATPAIRDRKVVTLDGGGHFPLRDTPDVVVREVNEFLSAP